MLEMLHILLLAALGGVRMRDAVEAASYERLGQPVPRQDALGPVAAMVIRKVDVVVAEAKG